MSDLILHLFLFACPHLHRRTCLISYCTFITVVSKSKVSCVSFTSRFWQAVICLPVSFSVYCVLLGYVILWESVPSIASSIASLHGIYSFLLPIQCTENYVFSYGFRGCIDICLDMPNVLYPCRLYWDTHVRTYKGVGALHQLLNVIPPVLLA